MPYALVLEDVFVHLHNATGGEEGESNPWTLTAEGKATISATSPSGPALPRSVSVSAYAEGGLTIAPASSAAGDSNSLQGAALDYFAINGAFAYSSGGVDSDPDLPPPLVVKVGPGGSCSPQSECPQTSETHTHTHFTQSHTHTHTLDRERDPCCSFIERVSE